MYIYMYVYYVCIYMYDKEIWIRKYSRSLFTLFKFSNIEGRITWTELTRLTELARLAGHSFKLRLHEVACSMSWLAGINFNVATYGFFKSEINVNLIFLH